MGCSRALTLLSRTAILGLASVALWIAPSEAHAYIYWSNEGNNALGRDTNDGNPANVNQALVTNANQAKGVAIDGNFVYWSNYGGNSIGRANLDGSNADPNFIVGASSPEGIAVNGSHIFWANSGAGGTTIGRANIDGSGVDQTFITGAVFPVGVAVDANYIYWANFHGNGGGGSIGRANLDGSSPNQNWLLTAQPGGVTVDSSHIFWTEAIQFGAILRANVADGSSPVTLDSATFPDEIVSDGTYIYWTNRYATQAVCAGPGTCTIGRAFLDGSGVNQSFISGASSVWGLAIGLLPANIAPPVITGSAVGGNALTESHGAWANGPSSFAYQWSRCNASGASCVPVSGATGQTYGLGPADVGATVRVQEIASNLNGGNSPAVSSGPTAVVQAPPPPVNTAPPSIGGSMVQGQVLTEAHGHWTTPPASFSYQWLRCNSSGAKCSPIAGATGPSYLLNGADIGASLRVREIATDAYRHPGAPALSIAGATVRALAPRVTNTQTIGPTASLTLHCAAPSGQACAGAATIAVTTRKRARTVAARRLTRRVNVTVTLASRRYNVAAGHSLTLKIKLNRTGRRLLAKSDLTGKLTLGGTVAGTIVFRYRPINPLVSFHWSISGSTTMDSLLIHLLPHAARVQIICHGGGCPSRGVVLTTRSVASRISVARPLGAAQLVPGAIVQVKVTAPNSVIFVETATIRASAPVYSCTQQRPGAGKRVRVHCSNS